MRYRGELMEQQPDIEIRVVSRHALGWRVGRDAFNAASTTTAHRLAVGWLIVAAACASDNASAPHSPLARFSVRRGKARSLQWETDPPGNYRSSR
jgi:hypothetical protein